ncbi:MAG: hypothetical protein ABIH38_04645 [Patescibacteria group bacterium]
MKIVNQLIISLAIGLVLSLLFNRLLQKESVQRFVLWIASLTGKSE